MVNAKGALWGLIIGELVGLTRIITDLLAQEDLLKNSVLYYFNSINFLHFAIISFVVSSVAVLVVSYFTSKEKRIEGSSDLPGIWNLNFNFDNIKTIRTTKANFVLSAFIVLIIFGLWSIWN
jgi:Na+/proline symporter